MTIFANNTQQGFLLAASLALAGAEGCKSSASTTDAPPAGPASASASAPASVPPPTSASAAAPSASGSATPPVFSNSDNPLPGINTVNYPLQGRAGIATMCIETRSYVDPQNGKIITPLIYINQMPQEGINTLYFKGSSAAGKWDQFLKPQSEARKAWLDDTDIPYQANEAFKLMKEIDKNEDGIVTFEEFEKGEKGKAKITVLQDLAYLMSLACTDRFMNEGPLNVVDPQQFPVVQLLNGSLAAEKAKNKKLVAERNALEAQRNNFAIAAIATGVLALGMAGLAHSRGKSGGVKAADKKSPPPLPATEFLKGISNMGFDPDTLIFALRKVDPRLAHHFERNGKGLNHEAKPITTVGELAERIHGKDKNALKKAEGVIKPLGPIGDGDNPVLAIFELIVASANYSFVDSATRQAARQRFVTEMNAAGGLAGALTASTPPPPPAVVVGIEETKEIHDYAVNNKVIEDALAKYDAALGSKLADFYRANLASTDTTVKSLLDKVVAIRPEAVTEAHSAVTFGAINPFSTAMNEQLVIELVLASAGFKPSDVMLHSTQIAEFMNDVKNANGVVKPVAKTKVV